MQQIRVQVVRYDAPAMGGGSYLDQVDPATPGVHGCLDLILATDSELIWYLQGI